MSALGKTRRNGQLLEEGYSRIGRTINNPFSDLPNSKVGEKATLNHCIR